MTSLVLHRLRRVSEHLRLYLGLFFLGMGCSLWTGFALVANVLPRSIARSLGRKGAMYGFGLYLLVLRLMGVARFDLAGLDGLRESPAMILAPNHPGMLDALMVLSRVSRAVCVTKASLVDSFFMGAGARLAGYIRNDWFLGTSTLAIEALQHDLHVLIFPEGTRTERFPVNAVRGSIGIIAQRSGVPVQTLIVESDTAFLAKGWGWLRAPRMPMHFSVRLGERLDAPHDARTLAGLLEESFARQLAGQQDSILHRFLAKQGT